MKYVGTLRDSGWCLIQNGGPEEGRDDGDYSNINLQDDDPILNQGILIGEINEEDGDQQMNHNAQDEELVEMPVIHIGFRRWKRSKYSECNFGVGSRNQSCFDINMEEMYNAIQPFADRVEGHELIKRKTWMNDADGNKFRLIKGGRSRWS